METIAIVSIIASVGTLLTVFSKTIKKSSCLGCLKCESRTPEPSVVIEHKDETHSQSNRNSPYSVKKDVMNKTTDL